MVDPVLQCSWFVPGPNEWKAALWSEMLQPPVSVQMHFWFSLYYGVWSQQSWVSCSWAAVLLDVVLNRSFSVHSLSSSDQTSQLWGRLTTILHKTFKILLGVFFLLSSFCHLPYCDHEGLKLIFNISVPCISYCCCFLFIDTCQHWLSKTNNLVVL